MRTNIMSKSICSCGNRKSSGALACNKCLPVVNDYLDLLDLPADKYAECVQQFREEGFGPVGVCAVCGRNYIFASNDPNPHLPVIARSCVRCVNMIMEHAAQSAYETVMQHYK